MDGTVLLGSRKNRQGRILLHPFILEAREVVHTSSGEPFCWRVMVREKSEPVERVGARHGPMVSVLCVSRDSRRAVEVMAQTDSASLPGFDAGFRERFRSALLAEVATWVRLFPRQGGVPAALRERSLCISEQRVPELERVLGDLATVIAQRDEMAEQLTIVLRPGSPLQEEGWQRPDLIFYRDDEVIRNMSWVERQTRAVIAALGAMDANWAPERMIVDRLPGETEKNVTFPVLLIRGRARRTLSAHDKVRLMTQVAPFLMPKESFEKA